MTENKGHEKGFPVVGIGASAGGFKALKEFFTHMTEDTESGIAFVLVQHLSPECKSNLRGLIEQFTEMPVQEVEDGMEILPNNIYIIPPNRYMVFVKGRLFLNKPVQQRGTRFSIDYFFCSLAESLRERSICILLSGAGNDGTLGLRAIKGEGGMTMVQDPETAESDSMPRSAINTGLVDYVLPPREMSAYLTSYVKYAVDKKKQQIISSVFKDEDLLQEILNHLCCQMGHDFSYYKQSTIKRRIERRMAVKQINRLEDYLAYLQTSSPEVKSLFKDMLVGVTSFFRDTEAFDIFKERVVPDLFSGKAPGDSIRIWVPGCSTGEEAYSIAILLQEQLEDLNQYYKVCIFATDIDSHAIKQARTGVYPASIASNVSPERLKRFFTWDADGNFYTIQKNIRDMLIFAEQNVIDDPPFTNIDLISCRNLLIFMNKELQKKIIQVMHYALKENGFMFLGSSETVGEFNDLFEPVDKSWKIYKKNGNVSYLRPVMRGFATSSKKEEFVNPTSLHKSSGESKIIAIRKLVERKLFRQYTPACVVVDKSGEALYIHGRTGKYLEPTSGEASMNILQMARDGLRMELRKAIRKAAVNEESIHCQGLRVMSNGEITTVNVTISPVTEEDPILQGLIMVIFEDIHLPESSASLEEVAVTGDIVTDKDKHILVLEQELRDKEGYLQSTLEELEASNEELQSINEEYQSANEELETSKEELKAVNEELAMVNTEMQNKIEELSRSFNDTKNMLAGTEVGTIFVDKLLRIKRFTHPATEVINLIESDVGRPLSHFSLNLLNYENLIEDVQSVLDTLVPKEIEVQTKNGLWYKMRIMPYRTLENAIEGAVITFIDITNSLNRLAVVVMDSRDAITVQDFEGTIHSWNPGAEKLYGWKEFQVLNKSINIVVPEEKQGEEMEKLKKLALNEDVEPYQTLRVTKEGRLINVFVTATTLVNQKEEPYAVATTERFISQH